MISLAKKIYNRLKGNERPVNRLKYFAPICYHSVNSENLFEKGIHTINPAVLVAQIEYLKKKKFSFLDIDEYLKTKHRNPAGRVTAITFDDGYKDVLTVAMPILESFEIPFTIFLNTRLLNGQMLWRDMVRMVMEDKLEQSFAEFLKAHDGDLFQYIDWTDFYYSTKANTVNSEQLEKALSQFLVSKNYNLINQDLYLTSQDIAAFSTHLTSIGNHTHNHYRLSTLSKDQQLREIADCDKILDSLDCRRSKVFSIPFGENESFDQNTIALLYDLDYEGFLMTNSLQVGHKEISLSVNPLNLKYSNRFKPRNEVFNF